MLGTEYLGLQGDNGECLVGVYDVVVWCRRADRDGQRHTIDTLDTVSFKSNRLLYTAHI